MTSAHGADAYRRALASAQERLQSGERAAGALPWAQLKAELGLPSDTGRTQPLSYSIDIDPGAHDAW